MAVLLTAGWFLFLLYTAAALTLALDEVVHDLKSGEVSDINNSGLESQVIFLAESLGLDRAREEVLKARSGI